VIRREDDGLYVELVERIQMHHEEVFSCLTTEAGLVRWRCLSAEVDLRPGGTISFGWDEKLTRTTTIAILDYEADGHIIWDWYAGPEDRHAPIAWTVDADTTPGEEATVVTMRQGPFAADVDSLIRMAGEVEAWRWWLCNLRTVLEVKHDMRRHRPL
jgi:uncharacterized protein YndB with AHSA1/START domain